MSSLGKIYLSADKKIIIIGRRPLKAMGLTNGEIKVEEIGKPEFMGEKSTTSKDIFILKKNPDKALHPTLRLNQYTESRSSSQANCERTTV